MLQSEDVEGRIRELLSFRRPVYVKASHMVVDVNGRKVDEIVEDVYKRQQLYWLRRWQQEHLPPAQEVQRKQRQLRQRRRQQQKQQQLTQARKPLRQVPMQRIPRLRQTFRKSLWAQALHPMRKSWMLPRKCWHPRAMRDVYKRQLWSCAARPAVLQESEIRKYMHDQHTPADWNQ